MDHDSLPRATAADLQREGSALLLLARCPKPEIDPENGELRDGGQSEETTMRVSMAVLREWLKDSDTAPGPGLGSIE